MKYIPSSFIAYNILELLDNIKTKEKDHFASKISLKNAWLFYASCLLFFGLYSIYTYSTPRVQFCFAPSIKVPYEAILCSFLSFRISDSITKNKKNSLGLLLLYFSFLIGFYTSDCIERSYWIGITASDFLLELVDLNYISSTILILASIRSYVHKIKLATIFLEYKPYCLLSLISFAPILFTQFTDYDFFHFLHFPYN